MHKALWLQYNQFSKPTGQKLISDKPRWCSEGLPSDVQLVQCSVWTSLLPAAPREAIQRDPHQHYYKTQCKQVSLK